MKIKTKEAVILIALTIFLSSLVSAEILLGQTETIYNVGDDFSITITLRPQKDSSGFLVGDLRCENGEIEIYKNPYVIDKDAEQVVTLSTSLGNFIVGNLSGQCFIKTEYNNEEATSQLFELTRGIDLSLNIEGAAFNPGDKVNIFGTAIKKNGEQLNGFVEISVQNINFSFTGEVTEGKFDTNFTLPDNAFSGSYEIKARTYEKDNNDVLLNEGSSADVLRIKQIIKGISIAVDAQTITPGEELTYKIIVYDQAKESAEADVSLTIYTPDRTEFSKKLTRTEEKDSFKTELNYTPGYWEIETKFQDIQSSKTFLVEELRKLTFKLENRTLVIFNIGNVRYTGPLEVSIGGIKDIKEIDIPVGETKKFSLSAPDGEYDIEANYGVEKETLGTIFLTGNAISVEDLRSSIFGGNFATLLWIIIILIIAALALFIFRRLFRRKQIISRRSSFQTIKESTEKSKNLIDKGEKQEAVIISLNLKNPETLTNSEVAESLDRALWKAKEAGAKIYSDGDYRIIVLSQLLTKEKENLVKGLTIAQGIERMLKTHNKRSKKIINFGIGVNEGNLIVESKAGKFRFVSTGNTISSAKRMSSKADEKVFLSETIHRKTTGKVKSIKHPKEENIWVLDRITDRSEHSDFIRNFSSRNK
ncbi:hypothetical protein HY450_01590 [Candidatus Pacearchaeota archaeon]|nr:hypothetical protein [Candidatus Pacearchaeota archaeon]